MRKWIRWLMERCLLSICARNNDDEYQDDVLVVVRGVVDENLKD